MLFGGSAASADAVAKIPIAAAKAKRLKFLFIASSLSKL
jgi:hypothetical protein